MLSIENRMSKTADKVAMLNDRIDETQSALRMGIGNVTTDDLKRYQDQLRYAEQDMDILKKKHDELTAKQNKTAQSVKKIGDNAKTSFEKASKAATKSGGIFKTLASRFKGILLSLLIFNWISKGFNAMISGMKEGFNNLVQYSKEYNQSMSALKSANTQLKNSFATAFAPIVQMAIPYLLKLIGYVTQAMNVMAQFMALLGGKTTYTRAKAVQEDYAAGLSKTGSAAKKAAKELKGYLSPLDEINKFTAKDKDESGAGGLTPADMFEDVAVDNKIIDKFNKIKEAIKPVLDYIEKLKDKFQESFNDTRKRLGTDEQIQNIRENLQLLKKNVQEIFNDPNVRASADNWATKTAEAAGRITASFENIGITVAQNFVGGISKYVDQNKERIKNYLVSMFDISAEITEKIGEIAEAIANIFQPFGGETGQQVTANIIGIFEDARMGIDQLLMKYTRDLMILYFQPIIDNQEKIKAAFQGVLEVLEKLTGTIKDFVDETVDKLNSMYDKHIKPLMDSLTSGISDLVSKLLDFWNNDVKPVLDGLADKFDTVVKEHVQPMVNQAIDVIGKLADLLKVLWENILQPFIAWIIETILPVLVPIFNTIGTLTMDVFAIISDVIAGILKILGGLIEFLTGVFTADWDKAWKGIQDIFTGVFDTIKSVFDGVVQFFQDKIQGIKDAFSSLKDLKPSYTYSQPSYSSYNSKIPGAATGTVIPSSMARRLLYVGDNNRETEVISPLSTMKQAFLEALNENGGSNGATYVFNSILDGMVVTRTVVRNGKLIQTSTGNNPFELA